MSVLINYKFLGINVETINYLKKGKIKKNKKIVLFVENLYASSELHPNSNSNIVSKSIGGLPILVYKNLNNPRNELDSNLNFNNLLFPY